MRYKPFNKLNIARL